MKEDKRICCYCEREVLREDMLFTKDCRIGWYAQNATRRLWQMDMTENTIRKKSASTRIGKRLSCHLVKNFLQPFQTGRAFCVQKLLFFLSAKFVIRL